MKHLFKGWENIEARIRQAKTLFLFLDYDGTLTPIVSRPELALCPSRVKRQFERLSGLRGVYLAVMSGRSLEDVRERVGVSGITYVGNHGLEIENPAGRHKKILPPPRKKELTGITRDLQKSLEEVPGILFEEKGPILAVHYRNVPRKWVVRVRAAIEETLGQRRERWKTASGKMVLEIQPRLDFHKGRAVKEILRTFASPGPLPIYLGDDQTDEDAFRVVNEWGIAVYVGSGAHPSEARFFLKDPDEVNEFLSRSVKARRERGVPGQEP